MMELDKDKSGEITVQEWMNFLCSDPNNSRKLVFRRNIRDSFF